MRTWTSRAPRAFPAIALLLGLCAGCGDDSTGVKDATVDDQAAPLDDGGPPPDRAIAMDFTGTNADLTRPPDLTVTPLPDLSSPPPDFAGGCPSLPARLSETTVTVAGTVATSWPITAVGLPGDGAAIAWSTGSAVYFTRVDAQGNRVGSDVMIPGTSAHGLTASPTGLASLVRRTPGGGLSDELWLVDASQSGTVNLDVRLTGGNTPMLSGNSCVNVGTEWFDGFYRRGRILWTGTQYAIYFTLQRCWPDKIAHQGDTYRFYDKAGTAMPQWSWGCSHSLDVRLGQNGTRLAPVCLSDCYSQKGILLSNNLVLSNEPSGNCAGSSAAGLGGLVASGTSFWLSYTSSEGRASSDVGLVEITQGGAVGARRFLTQDGAADSSAHLTALGGQLLAGWRSGSGATTLQLLDASASPIGAPATVTPPLRQYDDFFTYSSGDAGWVYPSGTQLKVVRVRRCP